MISLEPRTSLRGFFIAPGMILQRTTQKTPKSALLIAIIATNNALIPQNRVARCRRSSRYTSPGAISQAIARDLDLDQGCFGPGPLPLPVYVHEIGPGAYSNCTYTSHFALWRPSPAVYVHEICPGARNNCTYTYEDRPVTHFGLKL